MTAETMEHFHTARQNYWWEFYGFTQDPLAAAGRNAFFYMTPAWEQHVDLMQLLARHSNELLIVEGVKSGGKTTLLEQFLEQLDDSLPVCRMQGNPEVNPDELIDTLAGCFDLSSDVDLGAGIRMQLNGILDALAQNNVRCLLVIDNADELPLPTLQALFYLQAQRFEQQIPLEIILAIESEFAERLQELSGSTLDPSMIKTVQLKPFELSETEAYLEQRFAAAGLSDNLPLSREDLLHIHQWSGGVPGRINNVAKQLLTNKLERPHYEEGTSFWQEQRTKIVGGAIVLLVLVGGLYTWQSQEKYVKHSRYSVAAETDQVTTDLPIASNTDDQKMINAVATADAKSNLPPPIANRQTVPTPAIAAAPNTAANNTKLAPQQKWLPLQPQVAMNDSTTVTDQTQAQAPASPIAAKPTNSATTSSSIPVTQQPLAAAAETTNSIAPPAVIKTAAPTSGENQHPKAAMQVAAQQVAHKIMKQNNDQQQAVTRLAQTQTKTIAAKHGVIAAKNQRGGKTAVTHEQQHPLPAHANVSEKYLLGLSGHDYTVQLIGLHSLQKMEHFIAQNRLGAHARYFRTAIQGKPWYVLVYGHYTSEKAAVAALKNLPSSVREQKPWVRTLTSVQEVIRKHDGRG